jgi:hypothetical protein
MNCPPNTPSLIQAGKQKLLDRRAVKEFKRKRISGWFIGRFVTP